MILYLRTACLSSFICNITPHVFLRAADSCCFQLFFLFQLILDQMYLFHRCFVLAAKSL